MQTSAIANRIATAAHAPAIALNLAAGQVVVNDWRLRQWGLTGSGPAWAAPSTAYAFTATSRGDYIGKGSSALYDAAILYDSVTPYDGIGNPWDYGYQDLGQNTPVTYPDGGTHKPYLSSVAVSATRDLICYYANQPFGFYDAGIYVQRVTDDGAGHLYWSTPTLVFGSVNIDDTNGQSIFFISFPRLQVINGEYWILATECSLQNAVVTYHLCYFRSLDGVHWSDREYLAGVSNDPGETAQALNVYDNSGTPTAFTRADLVDAYLYVSGTNTYLASNGGHGNFVCPSTTLVGITNPARQIDITGNLTRWSLSMPTAPTAAQGSYTLQNPGGTYNAQVGLGTGSEIIVPGAQVLHQAGYVTTNGAELITVSTELIDELRQDTTSRTNEFAITTQDFSAWLRDWQPDVYWEYFSPRQSTFDVFCDLTAFITVQGMFTTNPSGELIAGPVNPGDPFIDNLAYIHEHRTGDGFIDVKWKIDTAWSRHRAGVVVQGVDDRNFWAVLYNGNTHKFELKHAIPNASGHKVYKYAATPQSSGTYSLSLNTWYWLRVAEWHNRVVAWHSTDRINWTKVIDYTSPFTPANNVLAANNAYWGLVGKSTVTPNTQYGNVDASGGLYQLDDGAGNPLTVSLKFTTGAQGGTLRAIAALLGTSGSPPDVTLGVCTDSGGYPADITDDAHVLYQVSSNSRYFNSKDVPAWKGVPVPGDVQLAANTTYHIFVTFDNTLSGAEGWWGCSQDPATYPYGAGKSYQSTDGGKTWAMLSNPYLALSAVVYMDAIGGYAKFGAMYWTSGEPPLTIEDIATDMAAKASVLHTSVDAFVATSDLTLGGDGILWQPTAYGKIGDLALDADVTISGTAQVVLRASAIGGGATNGWRIVLDPSTQKLSFYSPGATLLQQADSLQYLPTGAIHVRVINWNRFIYVYVNECLAGGVFDSNLTTAGYVGLVNAGATWTNVRIPDMTELLDYHALDAEKSAQAGLSELLAKTRFKYFVRYDGSLRMGSFANRASVDTYQGSAGLLHGNKVTTNRFALNAIIPAGNYYALRFAARELARIGRRLFRKVDYTDAFTNEAAYNAGALVVTRAEELASEYTATSPPVWPAEREDRITVVNTRDGVSADYVVNDLAWDYEIGQTPRIEQRAGLRSFIA